MGIKNMRNWVQNIIKSNERIAIPIMTNPGIELTQKTVLKAVTDGYVHFEAVKTLSEKFPSAACTVIMDLTVEAEAFGASVNFSDNEIPSVTGRLVSDLESIEELSIPDMTKARIPVFLTANKLLAENIKNKPVFGGCIGPFSLAGRLFDMSELMMACYTDPEIAELLLKKITQFLTDYCLALKKTGVNGVIIAEPAAGLLSNDFCSEFSSKYIKSVINSVQDDYFMVIFHNCGNAGNCNAAMFETDAMAFHFGNKIDMTAVLKESPKEKLSMGNIDPVTVLKLSNSDEVYFQTLDLLKKTSEFPNFVLSTGCDVPPNTPIANITAFYQALQDYNITKN